MTPVMTADEWSAGCDPVAMLAHVIGRASPRKLRLFACASARQLWGHFRDERSRRGIEVSERFADGAAGEEERDRACHAAAEAHADAPWYATRQALAAARTVVTDIAIGADRVIDDVTRVFGRLAALEAAREGPAREVRLTRDEAVRSTRARLCELIREVFGNPFRDAEPFRLTTGQASARRIARVIYEERRFEDLPILADALEEAGCGDEEMLRHCREPREHVRGCWVLDSLLGQE